ncbi:MAG: Gldg family protein [Hyphomicrobiaceae bacterium]
MTMNDAPTGRADDGAATEQLRQHPGGASRRAAVSTTVERAESYLGNLSRARLLRGGIALAVVLFLAVNVIASNAMRSTRIDLTQQGLYSLSQGTRGLLAGLQEPLHLRLFLSEELINQAPQLAAYANRVTAMLQAYERLARGKITLERIDPKPFSDAEDRAVGFGINRIRLTGAPQELFFGLAATNSTNGRANIPVFSPDREPFLEYDLTRMLAELSQPAKPVIALFDGIGLYGNAVAQIPEQQILGQLRELYAVERIRGDVDALPAGTRVVIVVHPRNLSERTLFTIDQWVLSGGATLIFVDPYAETQPGLRPGMPPPDPSSDLEKLFAAWGVGYDAAKAVADPQIAIRTTREVFGRQVEAANLPWLSITAAQMARDDALFAQLTTLIMTSAGAFAETSGTTRLVPLVTTSREGGLVPAMEAGSFQADPRALRQNYAPADAPLILAARLDGTLATAFPDGKPEGSEATGEPVKASLARPNVLVFADADMLMDRNWVRQRRILGQVIAEPFSNNAALLLNAVEQMVGGVALSDLRSRGVSFRPFERIAQLEQEAETKYLNRQNELVQRLQDTERRLAELTQASGARDGEMINVETERAIGEFRQQMLATRAELRNVQYELRREVDGLKARLTAFNVALVPALFAGLALLFALRRPKRPLPQRPVAPATA